MKGWFFRIPLLWANAVCLVLLISFSSGEENLSGIPGAFAPVDIGPKGSALAGAQTGSPDAAEVLIYNPAALYGAKWSGGYFYASNFDFIPYNFVSGSYRMNKLPLAFGMGAFQNGDEIYSENEVYLGAASSLWIFKGGISWKLRYASTGSGGTDFRDPETGLNTKVTGTGLGFSGFDLGLQAVFLKERLIVGGVVKDAFSAVAWDTENEAGTAKGEYLEFVPTSVKFGVQVEVSGDLFLYGDLEAAEYVLPPPFDWEIFEIYSDAKNKMCIGVEWLPLYRFTSIDWIRSLMMFRGGYKEVIFERDKSKLFAFGGAISFPVHNSGKSVTRVSIDGGYQINTIFEGHNSPVVGLSISTK
ncbi:hypothetical protein ACFL5V_05645 [Fibrobacterota bacterium]